MEIPIRDRYEVEDWTRNGVGYPGGNDRLLHCEAMIWSDIEQGIRRTLVKEWGHKRPLEIGHRLWLERVNYEVVECADTKEKFRVPRRTEPSALIIAVVTEIVHPVIPGKIEIHFTVETIHKRDDNLPEVFEYVQLQLPTEKKE